MAKAKDNPEEKKESGYVRLGVNIAPITAKKVKYIALMEDTDLTQLTAKAYEMLIAKYEKENGSIPVK